MSTLTISIQPPGLPACSPLPTVAKASGVASNLASRASTSAPACSSSRTTSAFPLGDGVQRLLPEFVAGIGGEAEVEHEGDRASRARPGGVDDHGPVPAGQPARQVRVTGEHLAGCAAVGAEEGGDDGQ